MGDAHYLSSQEGGPHPACMPSLHELLHKVLRRSLAEALPLFAAPVCQLCLLALFTSAPGRRRSLGAALICEGVWPLSHSIPLPLSQSCRSLATPSFPLWGRGGWGVLSLPVLLQPCSCGFATSERVPQRKPLLQSSSSSVVSVGHLVHPPC